MTAVLQYKFTRHGEDVAEFELDRYIVVDIDTDPNEIVSAAYGLVMLDDLLGAQPGDKLYKMLKKWSDENAETILAERKITFARRDGSKFLETPAMIIHGLELAKSIKAILEE